MKLRVLVANDDPLLLRRLQRLLNGFPELEIVGAAGGGYEAERLVRRLDPDVVFLDVELSGVDGFEIVEAVGPDRMPLVVFVTDDDRHAVRAFEMNAIDYLLVPLDSISVGRAVARCREMLAKSREAARGPRLAALVHDVVTALNGAMAADVVDQPVRPQSRLMIRSRHRARLIDIADIDWVESAGNYVRIWSGERSILMRETLTALESRLPARFFRIHRSGLVNVDRIVELRHWSSGEYIVELECGKELKLTRTYRDELMEFLDEY